MLHATLQYLYDLERFGIKLGLEMITELLKVLGDSHKKFRTIHVTGTNGKGSTSAFIASVLQKSGYNVGLYISPHLERFNERITINSDEISDRELIHLTEEIRKKMGDLKPTFFEFTTALCFLYFARKNVDIAIIEVGMGGRLDATNVVTPDVSIITNVGMEHTNHLGSTLVEISREKGGIIKEDVPVITAENNPDVILEFEKICKEKNTKLLVLDNHIQSKILDETLYSQTFETKGTLAKKFTIPLLGHHQVRNACCALLALSLIQRIIPIKKEAFSLGLTNINWPGRMQVISHKPLVILDSAHNVDSFTALCSYIETIPNRRVLVLGVSQDKNYSEMVKKIVPLFEKIIVTQGNYKPLELDILFAEVLKHTENVQKVQNVKDAITIALSEVDRDELLLITGSLYLMADSYAVLKKKVLV